MKTNRNSLYSRDQSAHLPFVVRLVFIATIIACVGGKGVLGYGVSGLTWFFPLILSVYIILTRSGNITFPSFIWLPWIMFITINLFLSESYGLQRTVQLICPIIIGLAVSSYDYRDQQFGILFRWFGHTALALMVIVAIKTGILISGQLPEITGLAAEVMTAMLLCSVFASQYAIENEKYLAWWAILAAIPMIAVTRTAIIATGLTLPFTLAPLWIIKRIGFLILVTIAGILLFQTPRMQNKMFYSGHGEMSDVFSDDFRSTGRFHMWERFRADIERKPWFGYGVGAGEAYTRSITNGISGYPHNDWLLTQYDYGNVGVSLYAITLLIACIHAYRRARQSESQTSVLFYAGASSFISFAMLMYTDNIMVYASFFGNLQFTILGAAYGSSSSNIQRTDKRRVRW